jgi:hypothetical protein
MPVLEHTELHSTTKTILYPINMRSMSILRNFNRLQSQLDDTYTAVHVFVPQLVQTMVQRITFILAVCIFPDPCCLPIVLIVMALEKTFKMFRILLAAPWTKGP